MKKEDSVLAIGLTSEEEIDRSANMIRAVMDCKPAEFYKKYKAYKDAEAEFKAVYEPFKERLLGLYNAEQITQKSIVIGGGMKVTYVSPSVRTSIDGAKLKEEEPELAKKFTKTTNVSATLKIESI